MKEMNTMTQNDKKFTKDSQMERLTTKTYFNPYDVLELGAEASEVEIKKKFKMLSILVHPDKNKHEQAGHVFNIVGKAYKTLLDVDKRRTYQRVMREAKEVVDVKRKKDNELLKAQGKQELPADTLHMEV